VKNDRARARSGTARSTLRTAVTDALLKGASGVARRFF
jgi:hypothetical protein